MSDVLRQSLNFSKVTTPKFLDLPMELVGRWSRGNFIYEYVQPDRLFVTGPASELIVSQDGQELNFDGDIYNRTAGIGQTIEGVWHSNANQDEWHFRNDGTYTNHWDDGTEYFGKYTLNGAQAFLSEFRAIVTVNGADITFDPPYNPNESGQWSISGNQLSLMLSGGTTVYTRL